MHYEHVLQIYWLKGFFFSTKLLYFDQSFLDIFAQTAGLGRGFQNVLIKRFELTCFRRFNTDTFFCEYQFSTHRIMLHPINVMFSQVHSVNHQLNDLYKLNIIRLYLVKSFRGRSHALGKPVNGQRTWSNAWNSYNVNNTLRDFIGETQKHLQKNKRVVKINYRLTQKKYATKKKKRKSLEKKVIPWF